MNTASLMLAMALPAVQAAAKQSASTVSSIGGLFASMLQGSEPAGPTATTASSDETQSLSASVSSLAEKMRDWLRQNGIREQFGLYFRLEASGETQLDVNGDAATEVEHLLASDDGTWQASLRKLAAMAQSENLRRGYREIPPITIEVDDQQSKIY